jgi:hypothetical protein
MMSSKKNKKRGRELFKTGVGNLENLEIEDWEDEWGLFKRC